MTTATATIEPAQEAAPTTALALIESKPALELFSNNGLDPILAKIEQEARAEAAMLDISTPQGRKAIASLAHKIARSKTTLDGAGKQLVSGWKEQAKKVDAERARGWDFLETLQKEIRAPLTEWENADKERIAKHEANLAEIVLGGQHTAANWQTFSVEAMGDRLKEIEADARLDWQEFAARAKQAIEQAAASIRSAIEKRQAYDAEQAELERLRREKAEREQKERDERIAAEAAAKAKADAEAEAKRKADEEAARVKREQERAEQERQRIEREKVEAEARAKKAEEDRIAAEAKAKADRIAAEEKAAREKKEAEEAAAKRERERIAAEQKKAAEEAAAREADKKHRAKVNGEALAALVSAGLTEEGAKKAITAIAKGEVPHVKISY